MLDVSNAVFKDGMVEVSITIPHGLLKSFVQLMGSLEGFFKHVSYKTRLAKEKADAKSPEEIERRATFRKDFYADVVRVYDEFLAQGLESKEAVKATNKALKAQEHPWANDYLVRKVLSESGKFKDLARSNRSKKRS